MKNPLTLKAIGYLILEQINYPSIGKSLLKKMPSFWVPRPTHQKLNLTL
jgi:hypothetical protein